MKPAHHFAAITVAISLGSPASAEPDFGGFATWNNDDATLASGNASWEAECNGDHYVVNLERSEHGEHVYHVTKNGKKISDEVDEFLSRNTSYFKEFNWLESIICSGSVDRSGPKDLERTIVMLNFVGLSRLPNERNSKFNTEKYNAYEYSVIIENSHISSQTRYNLSEKIVSDLPQYLDEQGYEEAVPGTVLTPYYCEDGPPCPEFTGENAEK